MATRVIMPKVGLTMIEGMITRWLKREGEKVQVGEPLMVIMTEKVEIEILADGTGVLHQVAGEGINVPATAIVGWLLALGERVPEVEAIATPQSGAIEAAPTTAAPGAPAEPAAAKAALAGSSPAARRLATELGVDLAAVKGTGPGGKILESDVKKAAEERQAAPPVVAAPAAPAAAATMPPGVKGVIPMRGIRKMVAERMYKSLQTTAQMTGVTEVDATELVKLRDLLVKEWQAEGIRVTYTDMVVKAAAKALIKYPRVNAHLVGNEIHIMEHINIGIAVSIDDGLVVPVIHDADKKDLKEIARLTKELSQKTRAGKLTLDDVTGGTFTVSSMGMFNADIITPILNIPEVGILGVGVIREKPAVHEGQITKRHTMYLCMTTDHQAVDGAPSLVFASYVGSLLENPYLLFV